MANGSCKTSINTLIRKIWEDSQKHSLPHVVRSNRALVESVVNEVGPKLSRGGSDGEKVGLLFDILDDIARVFDTPIERIRSKSRTRNLVVLRQMYCFVSKYMRAGTLIMIGENIGGRDHTTAIHSYWSFIDHLSTCDPIVMDCWERYLREGDTSITRKLKGWRELRSRKQVA